MSKPEELKREVDRILATDSLQQSVRNLLDWKESPEYLKIGSTLRELMHPTSEAAKAIEMLNRSRLEPGLFASPLSEMVKNAAKQNGQAGQWRTSLDEFQTAFKQLRTSSLFKEMSAGLSGLPREYQDIGRGLQTTLRQTIDRLKPATAIIEALKTKFPLPAFDFEGYQEQERRAMVIAATHGWFIQPESPASIGGEISRCEEDSSQLAGLFVEILKQDMGEIESRLTTSFPSLAHIFSEAFALHREGRFVSSVPMFLIGADAIAKARTNKSVFTNVGNTQASRAKGLQVAEFVRKHDIAVGMAACFEVLCNQHALSGRKDSPLSRHTVLHGEDTTYHSEENSFRALSFLGFVGWLLQPEAGHLFKREARPTGNPESFK